MVLRERGDGDADEARTFTTLSALAKYELLPAVTAGVLSFCMSLSMVNIFEIIKTARTVCVHHEQSETTVVR